jgi:D-amino-acid oxidase
MSNAAQCRRRVLVIGAGVVGLTTALTARRAGYQVTVVAEAFAPHITSVVAGALWEWPPAVCGHHRDEESVERAKVWCMDSYERFLDLAHDRSCGVHLREAVFYFRRPVERDPFQAAKMRELAGRVEGFRHDSALIDENGVSWDSGAVDAYSYLAPMIDTERYMAWLLREARTAGCAVLQGRIEGPLASCERDLLRVYSADAIVNCTGLGAVELTGEPMYPLRGALIHVHNDGLSMPRIDKAHCMAFDEAAGGQNMVFIVPRGEDRLVLGGLVEPGESALDLSLDGYPPLREMLRRCEEFMPVLGKATLVEKAPVRVGLRPARGRGVRLDHEPGTRIVHNVGHGGSGVTFSWGCAHEAVRLLERP